MPDERPINERLTETGSRIFEQLARMREHGASPGVGATAALETAIQALTLASQLLSAGTEHASVDIKGITAERRILRKGLEGLPGDLTDELMDPATAMLIQSTRALLAVSASAVDQCEEDDPYEPMWRVRRNGKIIWTCGHQPPHESET